MAPNQTKASFIEPMLLLPTNALPNGKNWLYELKLDGYRAIAIKSGGRVQLRSGNDNDFSARYPAITKALMDLPDETVVDGEIVALDESGRPSFNALQNHGTAKTPLVYYIFDLMVFSEPTFEHSRWRNAANFWRKGPVQTWRADPLFAVARRGSFRPGRVRQRTGPRGLGREAAR